MSEQVKKAWKNGFSDGSGKGTITYKDDSVLRVHWGCDCCDYFDEDTDKDLVKLANRLTKLLNEINFKPGEIRKRLENQEVEKKRKQKTIQG